MVAIIKGSRDLNNERELEFCQCTAYLLCIAIVIRECFPRRGSQFIPAGLHGHVLIKDMLKTNESPRINNKEK